MTLKSLKSAIAIGAVAIMAIAAESCAHHSDAPIEFETRVDSIGYMMPDVAGDTIYTAAYYSVVWPTKLGEGEFSSLRDSLLVYTFGHHGAKDFDEATRQFMMAGVYDISENKDSLPEYTKVPYPIAYDADNRNFASIISEVTLLTPKVLVIEITTDTYFYGMPHGQQHVHFLNYSLVENKLLTADNIFKPGNEKAILDLINASAKAAYPAEGTLFDEPIQTLGNVQIENDAIVFVYQPYEVAPFSTGIVSIPVNKFDIQRFLKPDVAALLSQNE